jgi:hypothetical protein
MIGLPSRRASLGPVALLGLTMVFGCAKVAATQGGSGGGGGDGPGGQGAGGRSGFGGRTGAGGQTGVETMPPDAGPCQEASYTFAPKIPSVFVLVDRSGSEFDSATTGVYFQLRTAVLQVMQQLQGQVRFGFGAFVGDHATGTCVPDFSTVPIDINNAGAIATMYNALGPLLPYGAKADTPAEQVMPMVKSALMNDSGTGQKYMMFVTDSETDFCDDGNAVCPEDAVTYRIQDMYAAGIGTLIVGLASSNSAAETAALQNFANAGAGQNVALPTGLATPTDVYYQCNSVNPWMSLATSLGKTMMPLAAYASPAGTATVYAPTSTSTDALAAQISASLSGVKSCTFDLMDVNGKAITVDTTQLNQAKVLIQGNEVPLDPTNGWSMSSSTELVLNGTACTTWRDPNNNNIDFQFPCQIIVVP